MRPRPVDHDIKTWVDAQTYLAVLAAAAADDRPVSSYLRALIRADLAHRALAMQATADRDEAGEARTAPARAGHGG
jgi:hypothetical protein